MKYEPRPSAIRVAQFWTQESREAADDASLGWSAYLLGDLESYSIPGTHATLFDEPNCAVLARRLERTLARLREEVRSAGH